MIRAFCDACKCELDSSPYTSKAMLEIKWTENSGQPRSRALDFCRDCKDTFLRELTAPEQWDHRKKLK